MDTRQAVTEFLLSQDASIEAVAEHVEKDVRTVYRILKNLKNDPEFRVLRWGPHGAYVYKLEKTPKESQKKS